jgi:UTP--glucose-1-phosphate uridylyltransferase
MSKRVRKAVLPVAGLGTRVSARRQDHAEEPAQCRRPADPVLHRRGRPGPASSTSCSSSAAARAPSRTISTRANPEIEAARGQGQDRHPRRRAPRPAQPGQMSFVRQMAPLGLGHAVWCARDIIGDEPFAVMLPDMLMTAQRRPWPRRSTPMPRSAATSSSSSRRLKARPTSTASSPSTVPRPAKGPAEPDDRHGREAAPGTEPSNLFISGRYILQPKSSRCWRTRSAARAARSS